MEKGIYDVYIKGTKITVKAKNRFKALLKAKIKYYKLTI